MKRLNRLFALLLALALVCGLVPAALAAAPAGPDAGGNVTINETNFPDANFRSLVSDKYDSDHNGVLSEVERNAVKEMACFAKQIANLKGVEFFTALTYLECGHNQLTSLDVSKNTALTNLGCYDNQLTSLDVSKNTALTTLYCSSNQLTSLDLSKNTALTTLFCSVNQLTSLDVSKSTALKELYCDGNQLTSLDVSKNTELELLSCDGNQLTSLDLRPITKLNYLVGYYWWNQKVPEHYHTNGWDYDSYSLYVNTAYYGLTVDTDVELIANMNPFTDVAQGKYYYNPVLWAYYHQPQVTSGVNATTFGWKNNCTREQIVTFLWKAAGAPEPTITTNPFTDVNAGKYYYKAVLWAVENEITGGVSPDKFGVGQPCKREQAMTFLWKAAGSPQPSSSNNPFEDVIPGKWYEKAILWAVENGITGGVSPTKFGVGQTCTRAQIVTFLYKYYGKLN